MKKWPIALQVYSIRGDAEKDFEGTMQKVKEMGYDGVELAGIYDLGSAVACKKILDKVGLTLVSAHVPVADLKQQEKLEDYAKTGMKFIVIPWMDQPKSQEELDKNIALFTEIGKNVRALGMQLLYHNHDFEFNKIGGQYILESYYAIPDGLLQPEQDTCWVNVGGEDPAQFLRKYAGRISLVHLKDFVGSKTENMYGLIGKDEKKAESTGKFEFRPVGYGRQDMPAIIQASEDAGADWLIVEQDQPSMDKTPMECAEMSVRYLKSLMND